jgi:hypothetical protein
MNTVPIKVIAHDTDGMARSPGRPLVLSQRSPAVR